VEVISDTASSEEAIVLVARVKGDYIFCVMEVLHATILMANSVFVFTITSSGEVIYVQDFFLPFL
jgi:hypothetical protein